MALIFQTRTYRQYYTLLEYVITKPTSGIGFKQSYVIYNYINQSRGLITVVRRSERKYASTGRTLYDHRILVKRPLRLTKCCHEIVRNCMKCRAW